VVRHRHPVIEQLMTPGEVAREAGVKPQAVSQWHRRGKLPAVQTPGRHRRFRRADVLAFLAQRKERTPMMLAVPAAIMIMFNIAAVYTVSGALRTPSGRHRRQPCPCGQPHPVPVQCLAPLPAGPPRVDILALRDPGGAWLRQQQTAETAPQPALAELPS
jgi:excisionase family DNA binding protein